jgi:hypothetical protein
VQAIRGLPLLFKDTPEHVPKIVDVLGQLLLAGISSGSECHIQISSFSCYPELLPFLGSRGKLRERFHAESANVLFKARH